MKNILFVFGMALLLWSCEKSSIETNAFEFCDHGVYDIGLYKAKVIIHSISASVDKAEYYVNYWPRGEESSLKTLKMESTRCELIDLLNGTEYLYYLSLGNMSSNDLSDTVSFTTKYVELHPWTLDEDYDDFSESVFSYTGKVHKVRAEGIDKLNIPLEVSLVSKDLTDSVKIESKIIADTIQFTIPDDYLYDNPYNVERYAMVGIKLGQYYQYLFDPDQHIDYNYALSNKATPDPVTLPQPALFRVFNINPYIYKVEQRDKGVRFAGEFLSSWKPSGWRPDKIDLVVHQANGQIYASASHDYTGDSSGDLRIYLNFSRVQYGKYYHQNDKIETSILQGAPAGQYSAQLFFTYADGRHLETNKIEFSIK